MYIQSIKNLNKKDTLSAGGKGAILGELYSQQFSVPDGFVVLTNAFDTFIQQHNLGSEINGILTQAHEDDICTVEFASEKIQGLITHLEMPIDIQNEIKKYIESSNNSHSFAIRSSATSEDGAESAWAGQLETYLNISASDVISHIQKCWASLFSPRAISYKFSKYKNPLEHISIAVVVQRMLPSDIAGIAFSVHPVTENYNQMVIEAAYGLGEAVVSGEITPHSYIFDKEKGIVLEKYTPELNRALIISKSGIGWQTIKTSAKEISVINDQQIQTLAHAVMKIEKHFNYPVDVEWAYYEGTLYILQSRPITTLSK